MAIGNPVDQGKAQASVNSQNITSLANIANGSMIIGITGFNSNNAAWTGLVDPSANTYGTPANGTTAPALGFIWATNVTGYNSGGTQACSFSGAAASRVTQILSVTGMWTGPVDQARDSRAIPSTTTGTSTSTTSTTGTLSQANSLLIAALFTNTNDPGAVSWGSFTAIGGTSATRFMKVAYLVVASGAPVVVPVSWANSVAFRFSVQVFRGAASASIGMGPGATGCG